MAARWPSSRLGSLISTTPPTLKTPTMTMRVCLCGHYPNITRLERDLGVSSDTLRQRFSLLCSPEGTSYSKIEPVPIAEITDIQLGRLLLVAMKRGLSSYGIINVLSPDEKDTTYEVYVFGTDTINLATSVPMYTFHPEMATLLERVSSTLIVDDIQPSVPLSSSSAPSPSYPTKSPAPVPPTSIASSLTSSATRTTPSQPVFISTNPLKSTPSGSPASVSISDPVRLIS
ncbi:hypothetical protein EVG20_g7722, partial [Dentipellis fragilis]